MYTAHIIEVQHETIVAAVINELNPSVEVVCTKSRANNRAPWRPMAGRKDGVYISLPPCFSLTNGAIEALDKLVEGKGPDGRVVSEQNNHHDQGEEKA